MSLSQEDVKQLAVRLLHSKNPEKHESPVFQKRVLEIQKTAVGLAGNDNLSVEQRKNLLNQHMKEYDEKFVHSMQEGYKRQAPLRPTKEGMSFGEARSLFTQITSFDVVGILTTLADMVPGVMKVSDTAMRAIGMLWNGERKQGESYGQVFSHAWNEVNDKYSANGAIKAVASAKRYLTQEDAEALGTIIEKAKSGEQGNFNLDDKERSDLIGSTLRRMNDSVVSQAFGDSEPKSQEEKPKEGKKAEESKKEDPKKTDSEKTDPKEGSKEETKKTSMRFPSSDMQNGMNDVALSSNIPGMAAVRQLS